MLMRKTSSFTPDEANVDDLVKACELQQTLFCLVNILILCHIQIYKQNEKHPCFNRQ